MDRKTNSLTPEQNIDAVVRFYTEYPNLTPSLDQASIIQQARRIAELEQRLKRINAINDNPARFDAEIDELSKVTT